MSIPEPGGLTLLFFQQLFQVAGVIVAGAEGFVFEEPQVERDGGLDAFDAVLSQGAAGADCSLLRVRSPASGAGSSYRRSGGYRYHGGQSYLQEVK